MFSSERTKTKRRPQCPRPKRIVRGQARRKRLYSALSILGTAAVIALAAIAFWQYSTPKAAADVYLETFSSEGVTFGMAAQKVRHLYPRMSFQWQGDGSYAGKFVVGGRAHTVFFGPGRDPGPVFRISYREIEPRLSPAEIKERFSERFGPSETDGCDLGQCGMVWAVGAATKLAVRSRDVADISGRRLTVLTVTATDMKLFEEMKKGRPERASRNGM